jgi:hypothetical protein
VNEGFEEEQGQMDGGEGAQVKIQLDKLVLQRLGTKGIATPNEDGLSMTGGRRLCSPHKRNEEHAFMECSRSSTVQRRGNGSSTGHGSNVR